MARRMVSKTMNPGSNPGSPAQTAQLPPVPGSATLVTAPTRSAVSFESEANVPPPGMLQTMLSGAGAVNDTVPWSGIGTELAPPGTPARLWSITSAPARSWQLVVAKVEPAEERIVDFADTE